jgi:hypothetical protein
MFGQVCSETTERAIIMLNVGFLTNCLNFLLYLMNSCQMQKVIHSMMGHGGINVNIKLGQL